MDATSGIVDLSPPPSVKPLLPLVHSHQAHPRLRPAYDLAQACHYEAEHSHQVTRLALMLFDQLRPLHGLSGQRRFRLTCGALLHDIGWIEGGRAHHKTSLRLILESPLLPWNLRHRLIIGSIARYHRKALPDLKHDHFAQLSRADREDVRILSAILRVADGLDNTHRSNVRSVDCHINARELIILCKTRLPAHTEARKALAKGDLITQVFERQLRIEWAAD
jgi:exopolyphosphatase/pppGpp-phosphohydrolase